MESYGLPNDLFKTLNPIGCIIFGPVVQNILYPYLNRRKIEFPPIARIATGFVFMAMSIAIAAGIQDLIYTSGPCYNMPLTCPVSEGGTIPNTVNVFIQTPVYIIMAFSELFALATGYEYSYTKAPQRMKSFVQAISVFMAGIGSALGMAISTVDYDPHLTTLYTSLTVVMIVNAIVFWFSFRKLDKIDDVLNNAVINGDQNGQS
jgi:proton-dependent oligopeptide transporter, POT family